MYSYDYILLSFVGVVVVVAVCNDGAIGWHGYRKFASNAGWLMFWLSIEHVGIWLYPLLLQIHAASGNRLKRYDPKMCVCLSSSVFMDGNYLRRYVRFWLAMSTLYAYKSPKNTLTAYHIFYGIFITFFSDSTQSKYDVMTQTINAPQSMEALQIKLIAIEWLWMSCLIWTQSFYNQN